MKLLPMTIVVALAFLLSVVWPFSVKAASTLQWPAFHGNPARTGFSNSKISSSASKLWEITTSQLKGYGVNNFEIHSPIIDQNKVFFSSVQVFAADLSSGKILWNYKGDRPDFFADTAAAGDGKIFVRVTNSSQLKNMSSGFIYALDEATGNLLWKYQTKKQITHSNPVFIEGKVFVGDESGSIYAIDAKDGKLAWQQQLEAYQIHSSPAYEGGVIYVGTETQDEGAGRFDRGSYMYALSAKDGKVIWRFESDWRSNEMPNLIHGTPAVLNGVVYFGSENGWFYALNKDSGKVIWKKIITTKKDTSARQAAGPGLVGVSTAPALGYGKIFVGTWEGKFLVLSQKDGSTIWEYNYGDEGTDSSAVVADGKVCLGSHYLDFYCFNQENGKVLWKEKLGGPSAALANGILVIPNALAAAESPGSILVAFSDKGVSEPAGSIISTLSFDNPDYQKAVIIILGLVLIVIFYKLLKSKKIAGGENREMIKKQHGFAPIVIILSVALILALAGAGYFFLQSQNTKNSIKSAKDTPPPKREASTPLVAQPPADQMTYKEFKTNEGKFSFEYPSTWTQIDIKNLESMIPKDFIDKRELTMPLLLTDPTGGRIVFTTYRFDKSLDINQVTDEMKADSAKMGAPYEETNRKLVNKSLVVDYKIRAGGIIMLGRDLVFLSPGADKNDVYVVSVSATEQTWSKFDTIFAKVQSSIKLLP